MASLRDAREIARQKKRGMTAAEIAAERGLPLERVQRIADLWRVRRRESSRALPKEAQA